MIVKFDPYWDCSPNGDLMGEVRGVMQQVQEAEKDSMWLPVVSSFIEWCTGLWETEGSQDQDVSSKGDRVVEGTGWQVKFMAERPSKSNRSIWG